MPLLRDARADGTRDGPARHVGGCRPAAVGTAMMAAQLVTFFMIAFMRLPWMVRLVSRMVETRSRSDSVHSVARSTWS